MGKSVESSIMHYSYISSRVISQITQINFQVILPEFRLEPPEGTPETHLSNIKKIDYAN